jgi:ABC-type multidrug transport system ATPase subunit
MTTVVVTISSILRDAADLIDRVGLFRGGRFTAFNPNDPHCALTATNRVQEDHLGGYKLGFVDAFGYLTKFLGFDHPHEVYRWNDSSEEGEVQRVLRAAADKYDEENNK